MKERDSVTKETAKRYKGAKKKEKGRILDEYAELTGFARKYAISKLNGCIRRHEHEYNKVIIKASRVELPKKKKKDLCTKIRKRHHKLAEQNLEDL